MLCAQLWLQLATGQPDLYNFTTVLMQNRTTVQLYNCRDEVVWAQLWLYLATGQPDLLSKAEAGYREAVLDNSTEFSWDDKVCTGGSNVPVVVGMLKGGRTGHLH